MEDDLSSVIPSSLVTDTPIRTAVSAVLKEEADARLLREKEIAKNLENALDEFSDDDSDEESNSISHQRFQSYADHSSIKESFEVQEQEFPPNESNHSVSVSHQSDRLGEQSFDSSSEDSHHSDHPRKHSSDSDSEDSNHSDHLGEKSSDSDLEDSHHSKTNHSNAFSDHRTSEILLNNGNTSEYNSKIVSNVQQFESHTSFKSKGSSNYMEGNESVDSMSNFSARLKSKNILNASLSAMATDQSELQEEYMKLRVLYETRGRELEQIKSEEIKAKETYELEIRSLKLKLTLIEGEKDKLTSALQESQKLISEFRHEKSVLSGKFAAVQLQLSAEKEAKEIAQSNLQSAEITIHSLEQQLNEFARSENALRLRDQNESILKDLKLRHQKEVLQLKEEIDKLQENLNSKIKESDSMSLKMTQLQRKCEELQLEKSDIFIKLSANLEASQKQCQNLLESGTISELSILKLQIQHLQEEKSKLEKQNSTLKDEVKSLESELQTSEALKKLVLENENENCAEAPSTKKASRNQNESSLKAELHQSLKNLQSLRLQNNSLKEKLDELKRQLPVWEERSKLFESRFQESNTKAKELEKRLQEVLPTGSIPLFEHEKKVNCFEVELTDFKKKLHDISKKLKSSSANEQKLKEENKSLKSKISEILESHAISKKEAIDLCREKCLEIHENAITKLNEELKSKAHQELKTVCTQYENKIAALQKEIKLINDGLYDAKSQYIKVFEENKSLLSKIDSISKPKERAEIEREVRYEYEEKLNEMKKQIQEHYKNQYESDLNTEIERTQEEWTKQKMIEVKKFIDTTTQQMDEKFAKCLEQEKNFCQSEMKAERENFQLEFKEKINDLKQQYDAEKESLRENFQSKWKNEVKELKQTHQNEIELIRQKFENKIIAMENEIKTLNENLYKNSGDYQAMKNLQQEFSIQKQAWEKEKLDFINNELATEEKLTSALEVEKKQYLQKVKKYRKYTSSLKKNCQEKIKQLQNQNEELKKSIVDTEKQLNSMKEQYEQNIFKMEKRLKKQSNTKSSESQTEEMVISRKTLLNMQDMFVQCLNKIAGDIKIYLQDSRKRSAEQLQKALSFYHDHLISKIFQDVLKDACSITPNIYIPRTNVNVQSAGSSRDHLSTPSTMQLHLPFNSDLKFSNSTPVDNHAAGDMHKLVSHMSDISNAKKFPNSRSVPDSGIKFEDVSFDFVPLKTPDCVFTSTKIPEYSVPQGLFNRQNIFPERDSPVSNIT